jgi:hypothetical protein
VLCQDGTFTLTSGRLAELSSNWRAASRHVMDQKATSGQLHRPIEKLQPNVRIVRNPPEATTSLNAGRPGRTDLPSPRQLLAFRLL